jgi:hypothetical protein
LGRIVVSTRAAGQQELLIGIDQCRPGRRHPLIATDKKNVLASPHEAR